VSRSQREKPWASNTARIVTILLVALQLVGCAVDMVEPQATLLALFCMATVPERPVLEWSALFVWFVLAFSWIVGIAAVRRSALRPFYWLLIVAIPIGFNVHHSLVRNETFYCDAP
jgi:hypothetical protein